MFGDMNAKVESVGVGDAGGKWDVNGVNVNG